jgi:Ca-activated chloride channel family protein
MPDFMSAFTGLLPATQLGFDLPWAWLALPLPWLLRRLLPRAAQEQSALRVPFFDAIARDVQVAAKNSRFARGRGLLLSALWLLLVLAASAPRWIGDPVALPASGRDLLLAVDVSGSMEAPDMRIQNQVVQRIVAVKIVVDDFIGQRSGDHVGLILFGANAYVQAPLTFDHATVRRFLQDAQLGFAGDGTAIGDAIGLAVKRLRARSGDRHVLILITDGANNAGSVTPQAAAKIAADNGVVIYTIGIGADRDGLLAMLRGYGSDLDEGTLKQIADATGGRYFRARDPQELAQIYRLLDELEPVAGEQQTYRPQRALFHWPLGAALLLSLAWASVALLRTLTTCREQRA